MFTFVCMWVGTGHRLLCSTLGERRGGSWRDAAWGFWSLWDSEACIFAFCALYMPVFLLDCFGGVPLLRGWTCTWLGELGLHQLPAGVCWSQEPEGPSKPPKSGFLLCWWPSRHSAEDMPCNSKGSKDIQSYFIPFLSWLDQELPDIVVKLQSSFWAIIRDALMRNDFYSLLAWPEILSTTVTWGARNSQSHCFAQWQDNHSWAGCWKVCPSVGQKLRMLKHFRW